MGIDQWLQILLGAWDGELSIWMWRVLFRLAEDKFIINSVDDLKHWELTPHVDTIFAVYDKIELFAYRKTDKPGDQMFHYSEDGKTFFFAEKAPSLTGTFFTLV